MTVKKTLRVLGAVALGTALTACGAAGSSGDGGSDKPDVAVFLSSSANSYEQAQADGARKAAKDLGAGAVKVFDGGFDAARQIADIQDATTSGRYEVFVIEPVDSVGSVAALKAAAAKGIKVVCMTSACGSDPSSVKKQFEGQAGVVGYNFERAAERLAESAIDVCKGTSPCEVAYLNGDSAFTSDRAALKTIKSKLGAAGNGVTLVAAQDAKYDTATGRKVMQDFLQRNPNIRVLLSLADQMTAGAVQAIDTAGRTGDIKIVSHGGSAPAIAAVEAGKYHAEVVEVPFDFGARAAEIGIRLAKGEKVAETGVVANTLSPVGEIVTRENAADFSAQWK